MLEKIFSSQARVKILKLFLLHENQKYYIREIARKLDLQVNSTRRELENLSSFGLLFSHHAYSSDNDLEDDKQEVEKINKQEKKYYQINKNFILFQELKNLIIKAQILHEKDFVNKLKKIGKINLFILTGFFVNKENLEIDLFVVGNVNKVKFRALIESLEKKLGRDIRFTLMSLREFQYRKNITDTFLYEILENEKIIIIDKIGV